LRATRFHQQGGIQARLLMGGWTEMIVREHGAQGAVKTFMIQERV
jgi:hypothetical protein